MPTRSLAATCATVCIRNIRSLTDVGDFEYGRIRHILLKVTSPEQLHQIELRSPQICGEDAELWKAFIARDIQDWQKKNYVPKNPNKWYQVYRKYKKELAEEIALDEEILVQRLANIQKEKERNVTTILPSNALPKLPMDAKMRRNNGGVPITRKKAAPKASYTWGKNKIPDGATVLNRARREAKELTARRKLSVSPPSQAAKTTKVLEAPDWMVEKNRLAQLPDLVIHAPRKPSAPTLTEPALEGTTTREEKEQRLMALKNAGATEPMGTKVGIKRALVVDDSSSAEDDDDIEDLFSEKPSAEITTPPPAKRVKTTPSPPRGLWSNLKRQPVKTIPFSQLRKSPQTDALKAVALRSSSTTSGFDALSKKNQAQGLKPRPGRESLSPPSRQASSSRSPAGFRYSPSPPQSASGPEPKKVIIRKKAPVNIFNKGFAVDGSKRR